MWYFESVYIYPCTGFILSKGLRAHLAFQFLPKLIYPSSLYMEWLNQELIIKKKFKVTIVVENKTGNETTEV